MTEAGDLLLAEGDADRHRSLAERLQLPPAVLILGLQTAHAYHLPEVAFRLPRDADMQ